MCARLIGDDVGIHTTRNDLRKNVGSVAEHTDRDRVTGACRERNELQCFIEIARLAVEIARLETFLDPGLVDFRDERRRALHRCGEWLRAAHPAQTCGEHEPSTQCSAEVLARDCPQSFVGALHDSL